jgi:hypothetical protein
MALAPVQGQWYTWVTNTGSLVINLGGIAINSLYIPSVPAPITLVANGSAFYIVPSGAPQTVPVPVGATSVTLSMPGGYTLYVFATSAAFSPTSIASSGQLSGTATLMFDIASCGAGNSLANVLGFIPLLKSFAPTAVMAIGQSITAGSYFNIVYGGGSISVPTPAYAVAVDGNSFFTPTGLALPAAQTVATYYPLYPGTIYPAGDILTLRAATPSGGGLGLLKVALLGYA